MGNISQTASRIAWIILLVVISHIAAAQTTTWIKNGAAGNWNNAANWSNGIPSLATSVAVFNGTGTANCNIDIALSILQLNINAGYTGAVTNTNLSIQISSGGFSQAAGTFNGGTGSMQINGPFVVTGGIFNSTSNTLSVSKSPFTVSGGTFNANNGSVFLVAEIGCSPPLPFYVNGTITFSNLTYSSLTGQTPNCGFTFITNDTITVNGTFSNAGGSTIYYNGGKINLKGNVCAQHLGGNLNALGTTIFALNGVGTQVLCGFTCPAGFNPIGVGKIPNLIIDKAPTDTILVTGVFSTSGAYVYRGGVFKTSYDGILCFQGIPGSYTTISGPTHTIPHVAFVGGYIDFNTTINVPGAAIWARFNPTLRSPGLPVGTPALNITGDIVVTATNQTGGGTAIMDIAGTGTQTFYTNAQLGGGTLPEVHINANNLIITRAQNPSSCLPKTPGNDFASNATTWLYNSGNITGDGIICFSGSSNTIINSHSLPNVVYHAPTSGVSFDKTVVGPAVLTIVDTLFTHGPGRLQLYGENIVTGSIYAMNNGYGTGGTSNITIRGSSNASFSSTYGAYPQQDGVSGLLPNIIIDKPAGTLTLYDTISIAGNWSLLNGNVLANTGSNIFLHNNNFNLDHQNGSGTMSFYDLTIVGANTRNMTGSAGVNNRLVLGAGKILLNTFKLSMNSSTPANLVRTTGYVLSENLPAAGYGRFEWAIGNAASGSVFTYPFAGSAGTYIPFTFEVQTAGSAGGKLAVATYPTDWTLTPNNNPLPTGVTNINNILGASNFAREVDRFWIPEESGFSTTPVGQLTFTYRDSEWNLPQNSIVESRLEAHRWLPGSTAWQLPNSTSTRNNAANTVSIPSQSTFTPFTVVDPELPDLRISSSDTIVCLGTAINFFDGNVPTPNSNQWFFPGATPASSTATNPTNILYNTVGCKTVILEATYSGGVLRDTFPCFITIVDAAVVTVNDSDITCNGLTNGKAWVNVSAGTQPYSYAWSGTASGTATNTPDSVRTSLPAGGYSITVSDAAGCVTTVTGTITEPTALTSTQTAVSPLCSGVNNGSITINVSGGTPRATGAPYTYIWNPNVSSTNSATGLAAGTYNITSTDANGCTKVDVVVLTNPAALTLTMDSVPVSCFGVCDGQASATVNGGTPNFTYVWSNGGTTATITGLCAGNYSVTVTDGNGCTATNSVVVTSPVAISSTVTPTDASCFGATDGSATSNVTPTGGTFSWQPDAASTVLGTSANITGLAAGNYKLVATVAGCNDTTLFTIGQPTQIVTTITGVNIGCNGAATGSATVSYTGGPAGGATYAWQKNFVGIAPTTATITGLTEGIYSVIITVNGICTAFDTITLTENPALSTTTSQQGITCFNGADGEATVVASGGTGNYTYSWTKLPATPVVPGNTATITGLDFGDYQVVVTDDSSCVIRDTVTLANPAALGLVLDKDDAECFGTATGRAWATVSGGTTPYTYAWSRGTFTPTADDTTRALLPGFVTVTVTDANGCFFVDSINIGQSSAITTSTTQTNVGCFGGNNGTATVTATGGPAGSPTYVWSQDGAPLPGGTTPTIINLVADTFTVVVTIGNCEAYDTVIITSPTEIITTITGNDVACFGGNTGSATVTYTGGPGGLDSYLWLLDGNTFPNNNTATITNLVEGEYTVTVTVDTCVAFDTIIIGEPTQLTSTASQQAITCFNGTDGEATVTVSGGSPTYNYVWTLEPAGTSVGGNTPTITGLGEGVYQVVITDDSSCTLLDTVTLVNPTAVGLQMGSDSVSCFGACDGSAWVFANGGTTPYTYLWSNNGTTDTITGLCAGWYFVTVTDANGCDNNDSIFVGEPTQITTSIAPTNVTCFGGNDGEATITVSGGPTGFTPTFDWLQNGAPIAGGNAATVTGLVADTFTVTVNVDGCLAFDTIIITEPAEIITTVTGNDVACNGGNTGSATVTYTGGPIPGTATYLWLVDGNTFANNTNATITNLVAGEYTVTVTINGVCEAFDTIEIFEPTQLTSTTSQQDISCFNGTDGEVTVTPAGGTGPYTYNWTLQPAGTSVGNTPTITGLGAGVYEVEITDDSSCTLLDTVTLIDPAALGLQMGADSVSCFGACDGSAWVVTNGGTTPYTFAWSNGTTTDTITGLCAGWYFVTVTDAGGCANNDSIFVGEPTQITTSIASTNVSCFGGNDGEATITVSGGPANSIPTFDWLQNGAPIAGGNLATVTGLVADTFTVTVNVGGCLAFDTIIITEPTEIITTITGTNITCFGAADGTASVTHTGGPTPAIDTAYTWLVDGNTFANNTTATVTNLGPGEYTVTVEIDGCFGFDTIQIFEPTQLASTITGTDPDCNGGTVGSTVTVTATGGTPFSGVNAYNYAWTLDGAPIGSNTPTVSSFGSGQYIVTITDSNSCTINDTIVLNDPSAIVITKDSLNVKCFGDANGKAWVTISGGTPGTITPYTITWGGGVVVPPGDTIDNLLAGTYPLTVTDGRGCTALDTFFISEPPALGVAVDFDSISCFGGSDGRAWATASGGVGGYQYSWNLGNPTNLTGDTIDGLSNLTYTITVTDDSTCTAVNSVTVPQPSEIVLTHDSINVLCFGDSTGKAWVTATGGSPGYTYLWSDGTPTNATGDTIGILTAGPYYVTVTDGNGCTAFDTVIITQPASALTLVMDSTNVSCFGLTDGKAWVTVTGGTQIFGSYDYVWSGGTPIGQQDTIINLAVNTYIVTVSDSNGCVAIDSVMITEPPVLTLTKDSINVLCFGDSTGKAWVTVAGGTPGYNNVVWTGPGTPSGPLNDTLNDLAAGTYVASITDTNGCVATATFTITQPTPLVLNMFAEDVNCFGDSTGKAWVVVTGGTPGTNPVYTYDWGGSGTQAGAGDTIKILVAGTYTVTVTDANGCSDTNSITILQPTAPLAITMDSSDIGCFGETTGKAWATVTGGTGPYTYGWPAGTVPSGPDGDTIINLAAGVYPVTVTDALGCTIVDSISVAEPPLLVATTTGSNITCFGDSTGRAFVTATGGTGPYSFAWSGGNAVSNGDTIIGLGAGSYIVTVIDASLCEAYDTVTITEPAELIITMDSLNVSCNGANDGVAWVIASGGTGPYTYDWSNSATTDTITGLSPGIYVVTVTDLFNCTKIGAVTIDEPNLLLGNIQHVNVRCFGENSGRAWANAVGGTSPYRFAWSGGTQTNALGDTIVDLIAGTYYLTITDTNGCVFNDSVIVTEPAQLLTTMDSIDVLCFGDSTGRAWVTASGGLIGPGYNYNWSGGTPIGDGDTIRTLRAGTYYVTVTDDTGCIALDTILINQPATPVTLQKDSLNILCFGDSTGKAWVRASGGTIATGTNYTYTWSRGTPTNAVGDTVGNLTFGIVRVTVTDNNGCEARATFNITQPNQLLSAVAQQNVLCFGQNTGKAWVTVTGGNGGYQYSWNGAAPSSTGDTLQNVAAGTYYVDVVDGNGCTLRDSVTITEPAAPLATTLDTTGVLCFGGNSGRAWVDVTGGTPLYTYAWSAGVPFGAGDSTLNLSAGPVSVTVTDANGCTLSDTIVVTEPATALSIVMDSTDVNCFSACDGKAWVTASGGTAGYTYQWANTTVTVDTLSALCPGNYVVTVTDANGCRAIDLVSIIEPKELLLTTVVDSSAYCNGNGRGQVTVSLTGGTGPYDYRWSNGDSTIASAAASNTITDVDAGSYTVTVTDANGCIATSTIDVFVRSNPQVVNIDVTATLCNEPNGAIVLTVNTTDPTLTYDWSHDANLNSPNASNLATATYTVTITAASTCDTVIDIFVPAINPPVVDSVIVKDSYCGNEDGVASVQVTSGTPPYVFTWSHDTSLVTNTATDLVEGTYTVTVTDANGCDTTLSVSIVEIEAPQLSVVPNVPQTIYSGQAVDIEVSLVSPIDSVYYEWLEFPGLDCYDCTNPIATPDRSTTYQVRVTDNFTGCTDTAYVTIVVRDETNIFIPNAITPNGDGANDTWVLRELATFPDNEVIILNRWGDVVFSASPYQNDFDGTYNGTPLPAGTYYYIIKLDNISESVTGPITIIK